MKEVITRKLGLEVFNGKTALRSATRELDFLAYGTLLSERSEGIIKELQKIKR